MGIVEFSGTGGGIETVPSVKQRVVVAGGDNTKKGEKNGKRRNCRLKEGSPLVR